MKLKYLSQLRYGDALATDAKKSGDVAVYGSNGQIDVHSKANFLSPGIVIGRKGSYGKLTWASNGGFCIDTAYFIDRTCTCANLRYVYYMLHTLKLDVGSRDSAVPGLDRQIAHDKTVHQHDLHTQKLIADFLDRKTTQIDQAIKTREQQITLLNEYKQIIIQNAVTKGLDSRVSLKNSGVQWIGNIPCSWKLVRFGNLFTERRQKVSDRDYKPLSVTKTGIYPQLENVAKSNDADNRKLVKAGDFVINSRSDRKGSSGVSSLDGSVSLINIVLEPKNIIPGFCNYILKSHAFVEEYYRMGHGIVSDLWTTRYDKMRTIVMPLPSIEEQKTITNFLDTKIASIYQAIEIKTRQIAALKEYRATLINAAVTGKLDIT